jgi:hypothetical protein
MSPDWPNCERCGGGIWKVHRYRLTEGYERQEFTCRDCEHVMELTVPVTDDPPKALRRSA